MISLSKVKEPFYIAYMDENQIKWYAIIASFIIVLIESTIFLLLFYYYLDIDWSLMLQYFDIYVPILFFVSLKMNKSLGEKIRYYQLTALKTAKDTLSNTLIVSHLLSLNLFFLYFMVTNSTVQENFENIGTIIMGFFVINLVSLITIALGTILPNQLFGYFLFKIVERFK